MQGMKMGRQGKASSRYRSVTEADLQVGRNVRKYRRERNLTLVELAGMLDISPQQLQKYETGKDRLTAGRVHDVAIVLKLPIKALFEKVHSTTNGKKSKAEHLRDECRMWIEQAQSKETLEQMVRVLRAMK